MYAMPLLCYMAIAVGSQAPEDAEKLEGEVETAADGTQAGGERKIDGDAEHASNDGCGTQPDRMAKDAREQLSPLAFKIEMNMSLDTRQARAGKSIVRVETHGIGWWRGDVPVMSARQWEEAVAQCDRVRLEYFSIFGC